MKNLFYLSIFLIACTHVVAQVGISTNPNYTPPANVTLSVDGSITVRDKIYAGGDGVTLGNPGKAGQVLVSQGPNLPPRWRTLNIPNIETNSFYLIYNNSFTDFNTATPGIQFPGNTNVTTGSNGPYTLGTNRNDLVGFTTISGLNEKFDVFSNDNQVYITFEAIAQIGTSGGAGTNVFEGVDFVCGVFAGKEGENKTLRGIRRASLFRASDSNNPFITYTQIVLADGLTIGRYDVEVACKRTANYNGYTAAGNILAIGRPIAGVTNMNNFMSQTSLKVEVYEIPQNFNNILDVSTP